MFEVEMLKVFLKMQGIDITNKEEVENFLTVLFLMDGTEANIVKDKVDSILVMLGQEEGSTIEYKEIFRLKEMLDEHQIPYEFSQGRTGGYQIEYFHPKTNTFVCSVIQTPMSYGSKDDLLEIMGLMTKEEMIRDNNDVLGYLTAEDVFTRIYQHYSDVK